MMKEKETFLIEGKMLRWFKLNFIIILELIF